MKNNYFRYLHTKKWRRKRKEAIKEKGTICEDCGRKFKLQIHHKTYQRIFKEKLSDLEILCKECHRDRHANRRN